MPTQRFFRGQLICRCGKHVRPDLDMMQRMKATFEDLVLSHVCDKFDGIQAWLLAMAGTPPQTKDAQRGCSNNKRQYTSIWDRLQNDEIYRESELAINW